MGNISKTWGVQDEVLEGGRAVMRTNVIVTVLVVGAQSFDCLEIIGKLHWALIQIGTINNEFTSRDWDTPAALTGAHLPLAKLLPGTLTLVEVKLREYLASHLCAA